MTEIPIPDNAPTIPPVVKKRRHHTERRRATRRRRDFYRELGKFAGLLAFVCIAILGQAELVGEPYRHWITVTSILCSAIWAYCMRPKSLKEVAGLLKRS